MRGVKIGMRVLIVLPDTSNLARVRLAWEGQIRREDELAVLACGGASVGESSDMLVRTVGRDVSASRQLREAFAGVTHVPEAERLFWSRGLFLAFLPLIGPTLECYIRSFDPDVVDLRGMPGNRALARRMREFPQIRTLSDGETWTGGDVDTSWRRYDPSILVSVVLPVFNGDRYLRESIETCLRQSHRNLELIIVDDGSTDGTPGIIAEYAGKDSRVVPIRNAKNMRLPGALNVGFSRATGELLTWTSCDNSYAPGAIEALARYLCTWPDVDFVYSATRWIDENGKIRKKAVYRFPPWRLEDLNVVGSYFLYRRRVYEALGGFRTDLEYVEDYDYWLRVYERFPMMFLHLPLYNYRFHGESLTAHVRRQRYGTRLLRDRVLREHFTVRRRTRATTPSRRRRISRR